MSTRIQLALDVGSTARAVEIASAARAEVDIVEAGTVLCLSEGLRCIEPLREACPDHPIVADIRIARAGRKFADMAFAGGANAVTVVGESGMDVIRGALESAAEHGGMVEVELGPQWREEEVTAWIEAGVSTIIAHRSGKYPAADDHEIRRTLSRLSLLDLGSAQVTLAGGIAAADAHHFADSRFDIVAVGSAIAQAPDVAAAARELRAALSKGNR